VNLCLKYCDGVVPDVGHDPAWSLPFNLGALIDDCAADMTSCAINTALFRAMDAARETNKFLTAAEPWKMKGADEARRPAVVKTTLEAIYAFMHFLAPVIPVAAAKVIALCLLLQQNIYISI
jgi:methionyl-tRNA synthetase